MTSFHIQCETCNAKLKVSKPSTIGQSLACPRCGQMIEVKAPEGWQPESEEAEKKSSAKKKKPSRQSEKQARRPVHPEDLQETMPKAVSEQIQNEAQKHKNIGNTKKSEKPNPGKSPTKESNTTPSSSMPSWQSQSDKKRQKTMLLAFTGASAILLSAVLYYVLFLGANSVSENGTGKTADKPSTSKPEVSPKLDTQKNRKEETDSNSEKKNHPKTDLENSPEAQTKDETERPNSADSKDESTNPKKSSNPPKATDQKDESSNNSGSGDPDSGNVQDGGFAAAIKQAQKGKITGTPQKKAKKNGSDPSFFDILKQSQNSDHGAIRNTYGKSFDLHETRDFSSDPASGPIHYIGVNESTSRPNRDYDRPRPRIVNTLRELERNLSAFKTKGETLDIVEFLELLEKMSGVPIWLDGESFFSSPIDLRKKFAIDVKDQSVHQILQTQLPQLGLKFKKIELVKDKPEAIGIVVFPDGSDRMITKKYPIPEGIELEPAAKQDIKSAMNGSANRSNLTGSSDRSKLATKNIRFQFYPESKSVKLGRPNLPSVTINLESIAASNKIRQQQKGKQQQGGNKPDPLSNTGSSIQPVVQKPKPKIDPNIVREKAKKSEVAQYLIQLIRNNVAPNTWKSNKGQGEIRLQGDEIVVNNTPAIQNRVGRFFKQLEACLESMKTKKIPEAKFGPRASQMGKELLEEHDIQFYNETFFKDMIVQVQKETGVKILVNWEAIGKQRWTPDTKLAWQSKNRKLAQSLDRLCFDMGLMLRIVRKDVVEITSKPFAQYRMDAELYSDVGVFNQIVNWQVLSTRLKEFFREEFVDFPTASIFYDSRIGCIIARLPQKAQRKLEAYLKKQREINAGG